jgi:hypothetical protein
LGVGVMNNTVISPQKAPKFGVKIIYGTLSKADGIIQTMLVPEYFLGGSKPLVIRLQNHDIQLWMWDYRERVSAKFAVLLDGLEYDFSDEGLMVSNHLGTVFTEDGNALHVVRLMEIYTPTDPLGAILTMDGNYTIDGDLLIDNRPDLLKSKVKSKEEAFIDLVKNGADGIELVYAGKYRDGYAGTYRVGHKFDWILKHGGHATMMGGFNILEQKFGLKPVYVDVDWVTKKVKISFFHKEW